MTEAAPQSFPSPNDWQHIISVALPFCSITLIAQKPTKLPRILNTIGDHIKKRRLKLGLLQRDVAKLLGVNTSTVTNWEKSHTKPQLFFIPKVIEFLGYDLVSSETKTTIGEVLLRYRKSRGMTQNELAKRIGIDQTTLSRFEGNRGRCLPSVLKKIGAFLNSRG